MRIEWSRSPSVSWLYCNKHKPEQCFRFQSWPIHQFLSVIGFTAALYTWFKIALKKWPQEKTMTQNQWLHWASITIIYSTSSADQRQVCVTQQIRLYNLISSYYGKFDQRLRERHYSPHTHTHCSSCCKHVSLFLAPEPVTRLFAEAKRPGSARMASSFAKPNRKEQGVRSSKIVHAEAVAAAISSYYVCAN